MIYQCVEDDKLTAQSEAMVEDMANAPTAALGRIKSMLQASELSSLGEQLQQEAEQQGECGRSADYAEGVRAFAERRAPQFSGK